jgi:hypothetical protein
MASPTLTHAPAVFFRGQYEFRTLNGTMAVIAPLLAGVIFAAIALFAPRKDGELLPRVVAVGFGIWAFGFGGLGVWALWSLIRNRRVDVEISEDGILDGSRFWPWDRVQSFAGMRYDNGVFLEFRPRKAIGWVGGSLPTTPALTDEQYVELAKEVSRGISARFPHVVVATHPLRPNI